VRFPDRCATKLQIFYFFCLCGERLFLGLGVPKMGWEGKDSAPPSRAQGNLAYGKGEQGQGCSHLRRTMVLVIEKTRDLCKVGEK
jgi:hypothetical protein